MKKIYLMLISATMITSAVNANPEKDIELTKVTDENRKTEILMNYANNFEEYTYIDDSEQLALVGRTVGISQTFKYVRIFKSNEQANDLLAVAVTEGGAVMEFAMGGVCDPELNECQCVDSEETETYGTQVYTEDGCQCLGSCNSGNPF